uniref:Thaumatin-like protein n=1 Tax=Haemonchus placei TaxID=6290 RepID=A0A0N4WLB5_HAEPC
LKRSITDVVGPGYNCFVDNGTVSGICKGGGCTPNQAPVPTEFVNYRGILEVAPVLLFCFKAPAKASCMHIEFSFVRIFLLLLVVEEALR